MDQAVSSGSNFVLVFLLARGSSAQDFGLLMIGYSVISVAMVMSRNAFGGVLGLDLPRSTAAAAQDLLSRSVAAVLISSLAFAVAVSVYAVTVLGAATGVALVVLGVGLPLVLVQDLQRFWAVAGGKPHHAACADSLWLVVVVLAAALPLFGIYDPTPVMGAAIWVVGGAVSSLLFGVLGYRARPRFGGLIAWLRSDPRRVHLASESGLAAVSPLINSSVVALVAGAPVVAAIRGAGVLFGPLNILTATMPLAVVPEARRLSAARVRKMFIALALGMIALAACWGVFLFVLPGGVGTALLGESWTLVHAIILITAVEYAGLGVWAVGRSRLRVHDRLQVAVRLRVVYSVLVLAAPTLAVLVWGTSTAVAGSTALVACVLAAVCWWLARSYARS